MINNTLIKHSKSKVPYRKSESIKELEQLAFAEARGLHPTMKPEHLAPRKFRDDRANDLTRCVIQYIRLKGGFASRISNQGTYNQKLRRYIPGTARRGLADVMATYQGKSLHIEIKIGKDRQSEYQKQIESEVTSSGGFYFLCKDFESFKNWIDTLIKIEMTYNHRHNEKEKVLSSATARETNPMVEICSTKPTGHNRF